LALEVVPPASRAEAATADTVAAAPARPITSSFDLPLFKERRPDEQPRVVAPPTPRAPLSVRRATPTPPRSVGRGGEEPVLGFGFDEPSPSTAARARRPTSLIESKQDATDERVAAASFGRRLFAGLIDAAILSVIGAIVLYLTLRICGVPVSRMAVIPPVPFASFLLLIAGGYFTLFTAAGGQTIGKMAAGIRVVPMNGEYGRVPLGRSIVRAAAYVASAIPAGLGFLPALVGPEKRAIHDRLADTRVVKA
jgi:uncharacterized RDD family membrane protein YckC